MEEGMAAEGDSSGDASDHMAATMSDDSSDDGDGIRNSEKARGKSGFPGERSKALETHP